MIFKKTLILGFLLYSISVFALASSNVSPCELSLAQNYTAWLKGFLRSTSKQSDIPEYIDKSEKVLSLLEMFDGMECEYLSIGSRKIVSSLKRASGSYLKELKHQIDTRKEIAIGESKISVVELIESDISARRKYSAELAKSFKFFSQEFGIRW